MAKYWKPSSSEISVFLEQAMPISEYQSNFFAPNGDYCLNIHSVQLLRLVGSMQIIQQDSLYIGRRTIFCH